MREGTGGGRWFRRVVLPFVAASGIAACDADGGFGPGGFPAPPLAFDAFYFNRAVHLSWELAQGWDGESFRIFGKRANDPNYFLIAEVTNCSEGLCFYRDVNVLPNVTYVYYVAAVGRNGAEAESDVAIEVFVPTPTPPSVPAGIEAIALDRAVFLRWGAESRDAEDFAFYRVYFWNGSESILIGETDSEGFLDLLAQNGATYGYFVTAVDDQGHESEGSFLAEATPRPDFLGEFLIAFGDAPDQSGFRFQDNDVTDPIVHGNDPTRHFRLEADVDGWTLVPGPGVTVHPQAVITTALRCGPASDPACVDVPIAPEIGYVAATLGLAPERSYILRVLENGQIRYGVVRITHVGFSDEGAFAVFDWAYQLQPNNRNLVPPAP